MSAAPPETQSSAPAGRQRVVAVSNRVRLDGRFFRLGNEKFFVKGVTYGPFQPAADGLPFASPDRTRQDFALMADAGINCLRVYHTPPTWFLDLAQSTGLKVFVDIAWPKNLSFVDSDEVKQQAHAAVKAAATACGNHPAVFALSVVNEIPPDLVRYHGKEEIEDFIDDLVATAKEHAPDCLITFANFPTTEYVQPRGIDFVCFNVYLHDDAVFRKYLQRLQMIAGEKPLILGEYGIDTNREYSPAQQAEILVRHVKAVFDTGLVGTFIFAFTDDWFTHGYAITDWAFGIVDADRKPKPAFDALRPIFARVPQVADETLPMCSIVICSYNGASTVESCLRSMERIRYPNYEVVFIDDGSKDHTQEILKKFPWVRNIQQKNMGLSYARNVGMNAARGDIIVYTDSDCEADEDWLYYIALTLVRSTHCGAGGPNLIPDEGSWIADCVGLSPGGPTHVMIDDFTAEHVPGCNMAFWAKQLREVNGFDPQYRKAGDDVDVIWRLQHRGYSIGFAPAAQVWHYRRNTVDAYLRQQRGYGEAEALLRYKHPDHFNTLGAGLWRGRIYGGEAVGVRFGGDVVYHGLFGTALFQTIYRRPASLLAAMMMSIEWHLLTAFVAILGLAFTALLFVAAAMLFVPAILAIVAALQAPRPKHPHRLSRLLIAYLHWRQPIARGWARYAVRLRHKVMRGDLAGYDRPSDLPLDPEDKRTLVYWSTTQDRLPLLTALKAEIDRAGFRSRMDSGWGAWDLEVYGSRYVKARIISATEIHHGKGLLTRVRVEFRPSNFARVLIVGATALTIILLVNLWPQSRVAILIPMFWWATLLVQRYKTSKPLLGLIDEVAEKAGYYPVHPPGKKTPAEAAK